MQTRRFILNSPQARHNAAQAILHAPEGVMCELRAQARNAGQNAKLHAMISDIARQVEFFGEKRDTETVKRLLVDAYARIKEAEGEPLAEHGQLLPSLEGNGIVQLGAQTRRFSKAQMAEFIEYVTAFGCDQGVRWSGPVDVPEWYQDRSAA